MTEDKDKELPNLRYQYIMNEPFVGGSKEMVEMSHDANKHKRDVAFDLHLYKQERDENMSVSEFQKITEKELQDKIDKDTIEKGLSIVKENLDSIIIKDNERQYGVRIKSQTHQNTSLIEFEVEKTFNLE